MYSLAGPIAYNLFLYLVDFFIIMNKEQEHHLVISHIKKKIT